MENRNNAERYESFHDLVVLCGERIAAEKRLMDRIELASAAGDHARARELISEFKPYHAATGALMQAARQVRDRPKQQAIAPSGEQTVH